MNYAIERARDTERVSPGGENLGHYLRETDAAAVEQLAARYAHVVPSERIRALRELPTQFDDREVFDQNFEHATGHEPTSEGRVLGFSRGTAESAHIAVNHLEIPRTVYHERLHQLSEPGVERKLGRALDEGITEDLAIESLGVSSHESTNECYPNERAIAHQIRERCGDTSIERAYFQGDTGELRRCLDKTLGAPGLERLQALLDDQSA